MSEQTDLERFIQLLKDFGIDYERGNPGDYDDGAQEVSVAPSFGDSVGSFWFKADGSFDDWRIYAA